MLQHHNLLTDVNAQTFVPFVPSMFHFTEHKQVLDFIRFFGLFYCNVLCSNKIYIPTESKITTLQCKPFGLDLVKTFSASVFLAEQKEQTTTSGLTL